MIGQQKDTERATGVSDRRRVLAQEMVADPNRIAVVSDGQENTGPEQSTQQLRIPSIKVRQNQEIQETAQGQTISSKKPTGRSRAENRYG
jgi:hypothetical protein